MSASSAEPRFGRSKFLVTGKSCAVLPVSELLEKKNAPWNFTFFTSLLAEGIQKAEIQVWEKRSKYEKGVVFRSHLFTIKTSTNIYPNNSAGFGFSMNWVVFKGFVVKYKAEAISKSGCLSCYLNREHPVQWLLPKCLLWTSNNPKLFSSCRVLSVLKTRSPPGRRSAAGKGWGRPSAVLSPWRGSVLSQIWTARASRQLGWRQQPPHPRSWPKKKSSSSWLVTSPSRCYVNKQSVLGGVQGRFQVLLF